MRYNDTKFQFQFQCSPTQRKLIEIKVTIQIREPLDYILFLQLEFSNSFSLLAILPLVAVHHELIIPWHEPGRKYLFILASDDVVLLNPVNFNLLPRSKSPTDGALLSSSSCCCCCCNWSISFKVWILTRFLHKSSRIISVSLSLRVELLLSNFSIFAVKDSVAWRCSIFQMRSRLKPRKIKFSRMSATSSFVLQAAKSKKKV